MNHARHPGVRFELRLSVGHEVEPEGIQLLDAPCFSVQYHPEASPGPTDAHYLFTAFTRLMDGEENYLDIDTAKDRLAGWNFADDGSAVLPNGGPVDAARRPERQFVIQKARHDQKVYALPFSCLVVGDVLV